MDACLPGDWSITWVAVGHSVDNVYVRRAQETVLATQ